MSLDLSCTLNPHSHPANVGKDVGQGFSTLGPHAARKVVLSGPRCNEFVSSF